MVSMDALLDAHEVAVRAKVEALREDAARIAAELAEAERAVDDVAVTRSTLAAALARGAENTDQAPASVSGDEPVVDGADGPRLVPRRRPGLTEADLPAVYRPLWRAVTEAEGPLRAGQIACLLGLEAVPAKIEGVRWKAKRLAEHGWITRLGSGAFAACPVSSGGVS
ncbi:hypothetical protein [Catenulispora subtropica]|uniref:Uncharacterized protein n=1 Tax=Catenulispora subtropica TaxID=450798 RepID=A0ABN2R4N6_9ACTN